MKTIFLVGFMGSGKTTIGEKLAKMLQVPFYDIDLQIEKSQGKSIPSIFQEEGEEMFRHYETTELKKMPINGAVVSTGGGILSRIENVNYLLNNGLVIYLEAPIGVLYNRVNKDANRPNAHQKTKNELEILLNQRISSYEKAHFTIDTNGKTPDEISMEIIECLTDEKGGDSSSKKIES
jgi:shikimate kinase